MEMCCRDKGIGERVSVCVAVLSVGELDGGS